MITMILNKIGNELGRIGEKVAAVYVKLLSANGNRADRNWTDVCKRQATASSLRKFPLHLSVKYINMNYNRYISARFIHTTMATTKLTETSRNIHAFKPPNRERRSNTRKHKIFRNFGNNRYCGVCSWPWQWLTREKADHTLLVTNNRCFPVTDTLDWSVVGFCACKITHLFSLVFCVVIAMWPTCIWLETCYDISVYCNLVDTRWQ
jgi:hypothetical protein